MEEKSCMLEKDLDRNCLNKPDFIDDVLLQKDLYGSYSTINTDPAYKPTYTFTEPDSPSSEPNPISLLNKNDKLLNLVTEEYGIGSEAYSSYREESDIISVALDPTSDNALEGCDYEEEPPTQRWEEDMIDLMWPEFSGADNDILRKAALGACMDVDSEGVDFAVVDAPELTVNETPIERTIDVSDYEIDTCILVEQDNANFDSERVQVSHNDNKIITEAVDHGIYQKSASVDLDISNLPQLSMDAIPMESILEGSDYEEVALIQVDYENMNIDLLGHIVSGIDNSTVSESIDLGIDLINGGIDMEVTNVLHLDNNAILTEGTEEISGQLTIQVNQETNLLEKTLYHDSVPICTSPGRPSFEGKSRSQSSNNAMDKRRRSLSQSCGRSWTNSSTCHRRSKSPLQSWSNDKSRDLYRRSRSLSVNNSRDDRKRSQSRSRSGIYSRDCQRRFHSRSWVNSRDSERRSQSKSKFGTYSRHCDRRTCSRSRSPINSRDLRRRSRSRSPINSRGFRKSQSQSHLSLRDLRRLSPRQNHKKQRNRPTQRSPQLPKRQQSLHCRSSRWSRTHQKRHLSPPLVQ